VEVPERVVGDFLGCAGGIAGVGGGDVEGHCVQSAVSRGGRRGGVGVGVGANAQRFWVRYTDPWPLCCVFSIKPANWTKNSSPLRCFPAIFSADAGLFGISERDGVTRVIRSEK
jgi:hypothetical protein